ncbi:MAG: hypothetical protein ABIF11_02275 [Nitrospirota bacterium]
MGNDTGIIFLEPQEIEAFQRWQKHQFLEIERTIAKKWRKDLEISVLKDRYKIFQQIFSVFDVPKSLSELKRQVNSIIENSHQKKILNYGLFIIGVLPEKHNEIMQKWENSGRKSIREFAPYFAYILSVDLFFYLGSAANLFSSFRHPQTHMVDIAYLYYLPFCNIFVSNDKLHIGIIPFFLRSDQTFVNGSDFKADLSALDQHYSALPEETKNRGVVSFASIPPEDTSFLVTRLWDKYMAPTWRDIKTRKFDGTDKIDSETEKAMVEKIRRFEKEAKPVYRSIVGSLDDVHIVLRKCMVSTRKGKWRKFPPEVEKSRPILD